MTLVLYTETGNSYRDLNHVRVSTLHGSMDEILFLSIGQFCVGSVLHQHGDSRAVSVLCGAQQCRVSLSVHHVDVHSELEKELKALLMGFHTSSIRRSSGRSPIVERILAIFGQCVYRKRVHRTSLGLDLFKCPCCNNEMSTIQGRMQEIKAFQVDLFRLKFTFLQQELKILQISTSSSKVQSIRVVIVHHVVFETLFLETLQSKDITSGSPVEQFLRISCSTHGDEA
mmetsp:Transcript_24221/g.60672  ORF Transcript_24221/g.60672 Transcript_24221/m.60672 type:complete len:228 (+) Transcript_24221:172-855(+)